MKVRIYKSPDGNGKYLNKTGQFLKKTQLGGTPDVSEMGYPGSAQENKEYTQDDLVNVIVNDLNNDIDEQKIAFKLSSFYSVDPMEAMQLVNQVQDYLDTVDDSEEEDDDETKNQNIIEEEILDDEEDVEDTNEEESADLANDSTGIDLALEEDEEDDEEYSYGGLYKVQEGEEVNTEISQDVQTPSYPFNATAPEITFPAIDTYLPYNISDMLDGTIDPATGIYINNYANEEDIIKEDVEDTEDTSEYALDTPPEMKMGGNYKRNKKAYVNSIIKLSKKADGGEEVKSDNNPEAGDPTGAKIRKQKLNNFIGSLKKETEMFTLREQAEKDYDQMMQQQQMPLMNQEMQKGGRVVRGNAARYRANQLKDFLTGQNRRDREEENNYDYKDVTNDGVKEQFDEQRPSYRVDVRKSNWLTGRPSKYTIDFYGDSPLMNIAKGNTTTSNIPKVKVYGKLISSKTTPVNTISKVINKESTTKIDTDVKNKSQVVSNDFYTVDANKDLIPDYLQPGIMSGLATGPSKDVFTQAAVDAVNNLSSIKSNTVNKQKSNTIIPSVVIKPLVPVETTSYIKPKVQSKVKPKSKKIVKNKNEYRDPTYWEQFQRFFGTGPMETGGFVDSENPDLYEFNQGGYAPTQQDMNYSNSIDTTDPYFQRGGGVRKFIENYFPGNIVGPRRTYRNEIQRVYDPRTGKTVVMPINMGNLSSVNVDKSRFSGAPKKYTMYFNGQSGQPITTSKGNVASQSGRDRFCLDFPNSPNCQGGKKPVKNNYPEDTRENNKNQRSGRQSYGFINDLKLRIQGLDEYGNPIGGEQSDKVPLSNVEMLKKQGKIWDEKLNKWVDGNIPSKMPLLPVRQIDRKPTKIISESSNNNQYNWPGYIDYNQDWIGNSQKLKEKEQESGNAWNDYINSPEDPANYGYMLDHKTGEIIKNPKGISQDERGLVWSGQYDNPETSIDESMIWSNPASQEEYNADPEKYDWNDSYIVKNPDGTESSVQGYSGLTSSQFSPYKENDDLLFEESENADENYNQYVAEIPQHIRKKNYKELNKQIGFDLIQPDGSVSNRYKIGRKIEEIKKRNSPYRYAPKQVLKQYGGNLDMFIPRAQNGFETSMSPGECPMGSTKNTAGDCVDFTGKVVKKRSTGSDFGNNTQDIKQPGVIDKDYSNPLTGEKPGVIKDKSGNLQINADAPTFYGDQYAIDVENKSNKGKLTIGANADTGVSEARLQTFNAGVDIADSIRRGKESNKAENEMYENLSSNNLYASDPSRDRGDYDTNSGLYRPNEQGQMWNSRSKQYGGYIDEEEYYNPYAEEEDELTYAKGGEKITYMSEDQIKAFMAAGGQVEFL